VARHGGIICTVQDEEPDPAYALALAADWQAAAAALQERWPTGRADDPYGDNFERTAEWWEECGDRLAASSAGSAGAAEAYRRAHDGFGAFASWATSGGEGSARMIAVQRVGAKLQALDPRPTGT
jgi:hypothetical protein